MLRRALPAPAPCCQQRCRPALPPSRARQVDVEGLELEVLRGMDDHAWALTRQVVAEVHDWQDTAGGGDGDRAAEPRSAAAKRLLERHGFAVHVEALPGALAGTCLLRAWNLALCSDGAC